MNITPEHPSDDERDEAFETRLRAFAPCQASGGAKDGQPLSVESVLYQAGYQAGRMESGHNPVEHSSNSRRRSPDRRAGPWMPMIAASVLAAMMTAPLSYRIGRRSVDRVPESPSTAAGHVPRDAVETSVITDSTHDVHEASPARGGETSPTLRSIQFFDLAAIFEPDWRRPSSTTEMLTASSTIESVQQSRWYSLEDEFFEPAAPLSAGDAYDTSLDFSFNR